MLSFVCFHFKVTELFQPVARILSEKENSSPFDGMSAKIDLRKIRTPLQYFLVFTKHELS